MAESKNALDEFALLQLRYLLFGESPLDSDVERWHTQGFSFSTDPLIPFGLTQLYGGPCGILAPIQGFVIRHLLFGPQSSQVKHMNADAKEADPSTPVISCTSTQANAALISALTDTLTRCLPVNKRGGNHGNVYTIVLPVASPSPASDNSVPAQPQPSESLIVINCATAQQVMDTYISHPSSLLSGWGVISFVYSVLLTRGIEQVRDDMDDSTTPLVARFGHCTQELVNLMLCGQAATNCFDGDKLLDESFRMKGIPNEVEVGFLSLHEAYRYSKVGNFYKSPQYPIWIVGSESHYTVLFGLDKKLVKVSRKDEVTQFVHAAFRQFDPEENGFIAASSLSGVLDAMGWTINVSEALKLVNPDKLDIILFQNFLQGYLQWRKNEPKEWSCPACTYKNAPEKSKCEVCDGAKPPTIERSVSTSSIASDDGKLSSGDDVEFLFHYNGIHGTGKAVAQCTICRITFLGAGANANTSSDSAQLGLREVIQTKWNDALVEFVGGQNPKIV